MSQHPPQLCLLRFCYVLFSSSVWLEIPGIAQVIESNDRYCSQHGAERAIQRHQRADETLNLRSIEQVEFMKDINSLAALYGEHA
jgi:hypothetical protein